MQLERRGKSFCGDCYIHFFYLLLLGSVCYSAGYEICETTEIGKVVKTLIEYNADVNEILDKTSNHTILHFVTTLGKFIMEK